jgi:cytochrome b561
MNIRNTTNRYGALSIGIHWIILLLFVTVYARTQLHEFFSKGSDLRATLKTWHFMLGFSILILASIRSVVHITNLAPRIEPAPLGWQKQ